MSNYDSYFLMKADDAVEYAKEKVPQIEKVFVHGFWGVALDGLMIDQKIPKDGW